MFDKRLFQLAPGLGKLIAGKVALMWVGLLANIGFMLSLVMLLQGLLAAADPHTFSCNAASASECPANLFGVPGTTVAPMAGDLMVYVLGNRLHAGSLPGHHTRHTPRHRSRRTGQARFALQAVPQNGGPRPVLQVARQDLGCGPVRRRRREQIQSFFELFLPQLFYAILAPITLFAVIAPINMPAAVTMLVCAPLIIIVTGIVSMTAARAFKKYWGRYTDMGAAFLDNLQGLETLKNFDADDRAAAEMDKKAEGFRVMTMRVLQIQLRSLTAMDIVPTAVLRPASVWRYGNTRILRCFCQWCVRLVANRTGLTSAWCACLRGIRPALSHPVRGGLPAVSYRSAVHCAAVRRILYSHASAWLVLPRGDERHDLHQAHLRSAGHPGARAWHGDPAGQRFRFR